MRKPITLLFICLLLACLFACNEAQPVIVTAAETTTETATETTIEITTETTTEAATTTETTTAKPTTTRAPSAQEILDSGVFTLRMRTEQGVVLYVSDGDRFVRESETDWRAMAEQVAGQLGGGRIEEQVAFAEATFGKKSRVLYTAESFYMVYPDRNWYFDMKAIDEEIPIAEARRELADLDPSDIISIQPKAERSYFSLKGYEAKSLTEYAGYFGTLGEMNAVARSGPFGRLFRFF